MGFPRVRLLLSIILLLGAAVAPLQAPAETWLIRTQEPEAIRNATDAAGLRPVRRFKNLPYTVYERTPAKAGQLRLQGLALTRSLASAGIDAQPDLPVRLARIPNDPLFSQQDEFEEPQPDADIRLTQAWDIATSGGTIVVAVIDSGVRTTHTELQPNLWVNPIEASGIEGDDDDGNGRIDDLYGWNTYDGNANVDDTNGHGTAVTGLIGAVGNNGIQVAGVCWQVKIMTLRAFGSDAKSTTSMLLDAIDYVLDFPEVRIVNASWGDVGTNEPLAAGMRELRDAGKLVITAAGNFALNLDAPGTEFYPASLDYSNMVSVGSVSPAGNYSTFSNYGSKISVVAPGESLFVLTPSGGTVPNESGTSFSAPMVTGAAALMLARFPTMTAGVAKQTIIRTARRTSRLPESKVLGGLIDVSLMVNPPPNAVDDWLLYAD